MPVFCSSKGIEAVGGGGSSGSDGFVAIVKIDTGDLKWLAVFDESNPFMEVLIKDNELLAVSSLMICGHSILINQNR